MPLALQAEPSSPKPTAAADAKRDLTPDDAQALLAKQPEVVVLDVRTPEEFEGGHIKGAKNLDFVGGDFKKQLPSLDLSKEYLVHCAAGSRSSKAVQQMEAAGFKHVYHLPGGMKAWQGAQKPVETGAAAK